MLTTTSKIIERLVLGFESRQGLWIFLVTTASRPATEPTQPPIHQVLGALFSGVKQPRR